MLVPSALNPDVVQNALTLVPETASQSAEVVQTTVSDQCVNAHAKTCSCCKVDNQVKNRPLNSKIFPRAYLFIQLINFLDLGNHRFGQGR